MELRDANIPEIGTLDQEYPEIGATLGMVRQKLQMGAAGGGIGPATSAELDQAVAGVSAKVDQIKINQVLTGGAVGRSPAAQAMILSDATAGGIVLAPAATVAFTVLNPKGYACDLARLRIVVTETATGATTSIGLSQLAINGDSWGDNNEFDTSIFSPNAQEQVILNREIPTQGKITGNLVNNLAVAVKARVSAVVYPRGKMVSVGG
jgi:hypothetical protein